MQAPSVFDQYTNVYAVYSAVGKEEVAVYEYFESRAGDGSLRYNFAYEGLTALDLALEVEVTVYGTNANGELCYGPAKSYSILKYCTKAMTNGTRDAVPCANLLMYGNAAQLFKNVAEEDLIINQLTMHSVQSWISMLMQTMPLTWQRPPRSLRAHSLSSPARTLTCSPESLWFTR